MSVGIVDRLSEGLAIAPLLPVATTVTVGLVLDHFTGLAPGASLAAAIVGLIGWVSMLSSAKGAGAVLWLGVACAGISAAYHHAYVHFIPADDITGWATPERRLTRLRGEFDEEPIAHRRVHNDPFVSADRPDTTTGILEVSHVQSASDWAPVSGRVRLTAEGNLEGLHAGDEVEVLGWLSIPLPPMNPGEWDYTERLRMDRIRAELHVHKTDQGVVRLREGWRGSFFGWLGTLRAWGQRTLQDRLPPAQAPVAMALLLGDGAPMTVPEWDRYIRTGVIHVLAISGQHLVLLGGFAWAFFRALAIPRRRAAWLVALGLLGYALLTGGRPSAMRAAVMVCATCVAIIARRRALAANTFALSWLVVLALNPTDLFTAGFQLSFVAVAVLVWGIPRWFPPRDPSAIERLVEENRPIVVRCLRGLGGVIVRAYVITLVLGLATAPLTMYWQDVISPAGLLIGPPVIFLSTIALFAGFLLLLAQALGGLLCPPFAWLTAISLAACDGLVTLADQASGACWYTGSVPAWWMAGFYLIGIAWLVTPVLTGQKRRLPLASALPAGPVSVRSEWLAPTVLTAWLAVGLVAATTRPLPDELRLTFLAVGHGGCTVLECPDGRCILYDAGALAGPDVARRQIAPFLWSRGIRRVDEIILSHADLDHFNGLPGLFQRFAVGQVTMTSSFAEKPTPGVIRLMKIMEREGINTRIARIGDRIIAGAVDMEVLHPPEKGPDGPENLRSMVLLVRHLGHTILLTGDLEKEGLLAVLAQPSRPVDVLMAPHHGSIAAEPARLIAWSRPRLAVSCQSAPRVAGREAAPYESAHVPLWRTCDEGAVAIHSHRTGLVAEGFLSKQRIVVRAGSEPRESHPVTRRPE